MTNSLSPAMPPGRPPHQKPPLVQLFVINHYRMEGCGNAPASQAGMHLMPEGQDVFIRERLQQGPSAHHHQPRHPMRQAAMPIQQPGRGQQIEDRIPMQDVFATGQLSPDALDRLSRGYADISRADETYVHGQRLLASESPLTASRPMPSESLPGNTALGPMWREATADRPASTVARSASATSSPLPQATSPDGTSMYPSTHQVSAMATGVEHTHRPPGLAAALPAQQPSTQAVTNSPYPGPAPTLTPLHQQQPMAMPAGPGRQQADAMQQMAQGQPKTECYTLCYPAGQAPAILRQMAAGQRLAAFETQPDLSTLPPGVSVQPDRQPNPIAMPPASPSPAAMAPMPGMPPQAAAPQQRIQPPAQAPAGNSLLPTTTTLLNTLNSTQSPLADKLGALEALALGGPANIRPETYNTLMGIALGVTHPLRPEEAHNETSFRSAALITMALLDNVQAPVIQQSGYPVEAIPTFYVSRAILGGEAPADAELKLSALQAMGIAGLANPANPQVKTMLETAANAEQPQVKQLAQAFLEGKIPSFGPEIQALNAMLDNMQATEPLAGMPGGVPSSPAGLPVMDRLQPAAPPQQASPEELAAIQAMLQSAQQPVPTGLNTSLPPQAFIN